MLSLILAGLVFLRPAVTQDAVQEVIQIEQELTDALARYDVKVIDALWADDLVFIGPAGRPASKQQRLAGISAAPASAAIVVSVTNDEVKVRIFGETAVVTLLSTWTTKANDRESRDPYMTTHVWVREQGRWRLTLAHVSRVAP
jgi:uncharacterized protein (TIGR02246 family)